MLENLKKALKESEEKETMLENERIIKEDEELIILQEDVVYDNESENFCIAVDGDGGGYRGYEYDPYIKVYNHKFRMRATKVMRITVKNPRFVYHRNTHGLDDWNINNSMLRTIDDCLSNSDVWKDIVDEINKCIREYKPGSEYQNFEKPDFSRTIKTKKRK